MSDSKNESNTKTPIYKKWWFWAIIVVIVIAIGGAGASSNNDPKKVGEGDSSENSETSEQSTFSVGDVIAVDGMEVSVTSIQRNWTGEYSKPSEGKEYVKVNLQINNKSDEKKDYNALSWKMEDSDGDINTYSITIDNKDALNSGELAKDGTKKGSLVFEVPKDDKNLKIHYLPTIFTDAHETIIKL